MELAEKRTSSGLRSRGLGELRTELDAMQSDAEAVTDAFYRDLEFGTANLPHWRCSAWCWAPDECLAVTRATQNVCTVSQ